MVSAVLTSRGRRRCAAGFSLVELIIVVAVILILVALLAVGVGQMRSSARKSLCASGLHQVGSAVVSFAVDHRSHLPQRFFNEQLPMDSFWMREPKGDLVNLGLVMDYVSQSQVFYCPTQTADRSPDIAFDSPQNPWRVDSKGKGKGHAKGKGKGLSKDNGNGNGHGNGQSDNEVYEAPRGLNSTFTVRAPNGAGWRMPHQTNKVIYSDFVGVQYWKDNDRFKHGLVQAHDGEGYNRLVGNGAVHWLDARSLQRELPVTDTPPDQQRMHEYFELLDVLP